MNWFKRNNNSTPKTEIEMEHKIDPNMEKFKTVFMDDNEPQTTADTSQNEVKETAEQVVVDPTKTPVDLFLEEDHYREGYGAGYNYQSTEMLNQKLEEIRASFNIILDKQAQKTSQQVNRLRMQQIKCSDEGLEEVRQTLQVSIDELNDFISDIKAQSDLCNVGQGWVFKATSQYRNGFIRGVKDYHETVLLSPSFNPLNH